MDPISEFELFRAIVDAGGISRAAEVLNSSAPAVSRRLTQLEARLGVRLAERSTRRFKLTDEGLLLYERSQAILDAVRDAESEISSRGGAITGLMQVGAPSDIGRRHLSSLLARFVSQHPGLKANLMLSDAGIENTLDGCDVVLRFQLPSDENMVARKIATCPVLLVASPAYLQKKGRPQEPQNLSAHDCLRMIRRHRMSDVWRFRRDEDWEEVRVRGALASADGIVLRDWVLAGEGVGCEAAWDVVDDLDAGRLEQLLPEYRMSELELYLVFPPGSPVLPRVRFLVDHLAAYFQLLEQKIRRFRDGRVDSV